MTVQRVGIVGAGTMGTGIAQVCVQAGLEVILVDVAQERLDQALARVRQALSSQPPGQPAGALEQRLRPTLDLHEVAAADLVLEAIPEDLEQKRALFQRLDRLCPPAVILASNTSALSITLLGAATQRPEKVVGMHFFNPAPVLPLVEVVRGLRTAEETVQTVVALARRLGKTPVVVRDGPGFVANRLLLPMINEAIAILAEGIASAEEIDTIMTLGLHHRLGPLRTADLIGLDVCLAILETLHRDFGDDKYRPHPLLRRMVAAGWLGMRYGNRRVMIAGMGIAVAGVEDLEWAARPAEVLEGLRAAGLPVTSFHVTAGGVGGPPDGLAFPVHVTSTLADGRARARLAFTAAEARDVAASTEGGLLWRPLNEDAREIQVEAVAWPGGGVMALLWEQLDAVGVSPGDGVAVYPPASLTTEQRRHALELARQALVQGVNGVRLSPLDLESLPPALREPGATFVTLTIKGELRGCVGALEAYQPLAEDVREHAVAAALADYRFPPVRPEEVDRLKIEISRLTPPQPLAYDTPLDLIHKLRPGVDGVVLLDEGRRATFLPQVWHSLPDAENFLDQLCLKMGAPRKLWRLKKLTVLTYQVEEFHE